MTENQKILTFYYQLRSQEGMQKCCVVHDTTTYTENGILTIVLKGTIVELDWIKDNIASVFFEGEIIYLNATNLKPAQ